MFFLANRDKCEKRRKQAASGGFLLDTFLCADKEKYLVRGYENPHSNQSSRQRHINCVHGSTGSPRTDYLYPSLCSGFRQSLPE